MIDSPSFDSDIHDLLPKYSMRGFFTLPFSHHRFLQPDHFTIDKHVIDEFSKLPSWQSLFASSS